MLLISSDVLCICLCSEGSCWCLILSSEELTRTPSPYMEKVMLTSVSVQGGIVDPNVYRLLHCPGKAMPLLA